MCEKGLNNVLHAATHRQPRKIVGGHYKECWVLDSINKKGLKQLPVASTAVWSLVLWSLALLSDNVELILQGIDGHHNSEGQDNDQPDYDSVASDEDPVQEATCGDSCNDGRTKVNVSWSLLFHCLL